MRNLVMAGGRHLFHAYYVKAEFHKSLIYSISSAGVFPGILDRM
jgi:hypothetical protein